jgi:hypothetical protein
MKKIITKEEILSVIEQNLDGKEIKALGCATQLEEAVDERYKLRNKLLAESLKELEEQYKIRQRLRI